MSAVITATIPVRNGEAFLLQTLESLARQTRKPDRVIVIDNCSTDTTPSIVKNFKEFPVEYTRNPKDLGVVGNFNRCIDYAGETTSIAFNARYLIDAVSAARSKEIRFGFRDALSPAELAPADDADALAVVMPMRL